jgi:hypothetical protein
MSGEELQIEDTLRHISLFDGLDDIQVAMLVDEVERVYLDTDELLFSEGDPGNSMYILFRGQVQVFRGQGGREEQLAILGPGDYFGEEAMLYGRPRSASVAAVIPTMLLRFSSALYAQLLQENPLFEPRLKVRAESHELARQVEFDWLGVGEVVQLVARKHIARLWVSLSGPVILGLFSIPIFALAYLSGTVTPLILGSLVLVLVILWGLWNVIDWGNDYYIVTNQRVVWLEKVVGLYESRQEAPLRTLLSVSMESDPFGRILGYGDVIVRTYTGRIIMRYVGRPQQFAGLIEQFWMRSRKQVQQGESDVMVQTLREHLGLEDEEPLEEAAPSPPTQVSKGGSPSTFSLIMANFFKLRYQEGSIITYRKHWFLLLIRVWQPTFGLLVTALIVGARLFDTFTLFSLTTVFVVGIASLTAFGAWWLYSFVDWRNDIFQLTSDHIVDIDRKPLGSEEKRSAPLGNILSLRHERVGVWGLLLNFGTVTARIGKAEFTFDNVHDPAQVQQDIFARMDERQAQSREAEAARDRARMAEWLAAYHRNVEDFRRAEQAMRSEDDSG